MRTLLKKQNFNMAERNKIKTRICKQCGEKVNGKAHELKKHVKETHMRKTPAA